MPVHALLIYHLHQAMTSFTPLNFFLPLLFLLSFLSNIATTGAASNVIDRCWRRNPDWSSNRQRLAMCSVGFAGKMVRNRGRGVRSYRVTDPTDDPSSPRRGTLRFGVTMIPGKVWITFSRDMSIMLQRPLIVSSFTTIDGRGADVQIAGGSGILIYHANNVIIHGLRIHHIRTMPSGQVLGPGGKIMNVNGADGDAIRLVSSNKIWIDHNTLYQGQDGLIDVTRGSTGITISNNWFRDHDKVMLLGHDDGFLRDRGMRVTVAFNRFGPNCIQRMPRIRHGYAHVANNFYDGWGDYAMGGSMNPTIKSQGNLFKAPKSNNKAVIWKEEGAGRGRSWQLRSVNDAFVNGAFFIPKGNAGTSPHYARGEMFVAGSPNDVRSLTRDAGALRCKGKRWC